MVYYQWEGRWMGGMDYNSQIQMLKNKKNNKDNRHSKSRNKRILTVYAVQPSVPETLPKATSLPLKKIPRHSITNPNPKPKQGGKRDKPKHHTSTLKAKPIEIYQRVPMNFVQSNSNSEIQFSNYEEASNEPRLMRKSLFINCDQQALIQQIWRGDRKKRGVEQEAAIKIQKVFRGYLTRKLLMQYVDEYEEKLLAERQILLRKPSFKSVKDNEGSHHSSLKNSYFPSNKKESGKGQSCNSGQKYAPIDLEYVIMRAEGESCQSIHKSDINPREQEREERRGSEAQPSSITLNESSIQARVQQNSLSFGQEGQHSPHFVQPTNRKQIGGEMFSPTKPLNNVIAHISSDKTRDAISQNISNCPSYSKANHADPSEPSHLSSLMKQEMEGEGVHLQKLRSTQKAKWQQVIQFVNHQMRQGLNQQKTRELMSTILQFSVKNKEELNNNNFKAHDLAQVTPTTMTHREQEGEQPYLQAQPLPFKKKKWRADEHQINVQKMNKNQDMPLLRTLKQPENLFDRTSSLKQYFLKTINFQDHQIDKMMQLREAVLRKKESHSLVQLQHLLEDNLLTQEQFLQRLCKLTQQFSRQKEDIEQTKNEIYQGYRAQFQLLRFTYLDAKYLGYQLPFCRSMEIFPNNSNWRFDELMIDELNQLAQRKTKARTADLVQPKTLTDSQINHILQSRKEDEERQNFEDSFSVENSVSFSYEQATISRNCQPFSIDISQSEGLQFVFSPKARRNSPPYTKGLSIPIYDQSSRNVTPSKNQQDSSQPYQEEQRHSSTHSFRKQTYQISADSEEQEQVLYKETEENLNLKVVDICLTKLIWETMEDIYSSLSIRSSLGMGHNKLALQAITKDEKLLFLDIVIGKMPQFGSLQERLNQKMYPNAKELLMSMRQASDLSSDEPEYFQIGQYEYILNQQICYEVIESYLTLYRIHKKKQSAMEVQQQYGLFASDRLKKMANAAMRAELQKAEENQELRQEIVKIQLHLMLDSWNQELIRYRQNKNGYSGIGLNELSLSLVDRVCRPMTGQIQLSEMFHQTRLLLADIIRDDSLNEKLIREYQQAVCDNDSQWIMYSQQALEYGFEIARTIQIELIFEMLQDLHLINQRGRSQRGFAHFDEDLLELNDQEAEELEKKMGEIQGAASDSDDSFYD